MSVRWACGVIGSLFVFVFVFVFVFLLRVDAECVACFYVREADSVIRAEGYEREECVG